MFLIHENLERPSSSRHTPGCEVVWSNLPCASLPRSTTVTRWFAGVMTLGFGSTYQIWILSIASHLSSFQVLPTWWLCSPGTGNDDMTVIFCLGYALVLCFSSISAIWKCYAISFVYPFKTDISGSATPASTHVPPTAARRPAGTPLTSAPRRSWSSRWTFWSSWWYSSGVVPKNQNAQEPWVRLFQSEEGRFQDGWRVVGAPLSKLSRSLLLTWTGSSHLLYHKGSNWFWYVFVLLTLLFY